MKKKVFFQDKLFELAGAIGTFILGLISHLGSVSLLIKAITQSQFDGVIIAFIIILFFSPFFIMYPLSLTVLCSWNIRMNGDKVWMRGDILAPKRWRVQTYTEVLFSEIISIRLEKSYKSSDGHYLSLTDQAYGGIYSSKTYLVFKTISSKKYIRMHVSNYSEIKLGIIIDEIINRIKQSGNTSYDGRTMPEIIEEFKSKHTSN